MPKIFLSPSTQDYNQYYDGNGNERYYMNLIADAMEPYLTASGISYTRNNPEGNVSQSIAKSNSENYDLHLALHSNASPEYMQGSLMGSDFYYYVGSTRGKDAATVLADNFKSIYPIPSLVNTVPTTALAEVVRTRAPSVLAELAYHDNQTDAEWIRNNIDEIAKNLVQGLCEYFDIPFYSPNEETPQPSPYLYGTVTTESGRLNIRDKPSFDSNVISQVPKGTRIEILGTVGEWYIIHYNGVTGFVNSQYITLD